MYNLSSLLWRLGKRGLQEKHKMGKINKAENNGILQRMLHIRTMKETKEDRNPKSLASSHLFSNN